MKKRYKVVFTVLAVLVCMAGFGWSYLRPVEASLEMVKTGDLKTVFTVQGTLLPKHSELLNSASNGVVKEIPFQAGTFVPQGSTVLRMGYESQAALEIQREQLRQQLTSARQTYDRLFGENGSAAAAYETARSDYELAEQNYKNGKILAAAGSLPQMELKALENQKNKAKQALLQAKEDNSDSNRNYYKTLTASYEKQLEAMESSVAPGEILMPYDGVVWEIYQEEGAYVQSGQPMVKVYQPGSMKIQASLLTEDAVLLEPGQTVSCKFPDGTETDGEIRFISAVAGQTLSTIGMEENRCAVEIKPFMIPEGSGAGHQVDVTFTIAAAADVLTVPSSALVPITDAALGGGTGIYVVERGKAVLRPVETGRKSGGRVEVTAGLTAGEEVAADPYGDGVKEGSRVVQGPVTAAAVS